MKIFKKNKSKRISIILLFNFSILFSTIQAQQTIPTTGGNAAGTGGSVSYSIGQTFYKTNSGINGSVAEGVQQPYEISVVIGMEQAKEIDLVCKAFPNPTNDILIIKFSNKSISVVGETYIACLYSLNGKFLESKKINSSETIFSLAKLPSGTYLLKIQQAHQDSHNSIKTFKIIKNH